MGMVARAAGDSAGVIGGHDLRKCLRLGAISFVTTGAYDHRIKLGRNHRCRILGVTGKWSVAGLTRNYNMLAQFFLIYDLSVASFADLVSGKRNRTSRNLSNGISSIVPVLAEAARNNGGANDDKRDRHNCHDKGQPNEMFDILKHARHLAEALSHETRDALPYVVFQSPTMIFVTEACDRSHSRNPCRAISGERLSLVESLQGMRNPECTRSIIQSETP
jgi:hypothetical protein